MFHTYKDAEYRESLSDAQLATLPANASGLVELSFEELSAVAGGSGKHKYGSSSKSSKSSKKRRRRKCPRCHRRRRHCRCGCRW